MERRVSHLSINRLEKEGAVIFPPLLIVNFEPFDHDLIVERGKQQAASCIYCRIGDSEALEAGCSQLKIRVRGEPIYERTLVNDFY